MNYQDLFEIDTNPEGTANYVRLGDGLTTGTPANNETLDQKAYLDGDGGMNTEVTGFQYIWSFSGDRIPGDEAQDFIFSKIFSPGSARKTNFRVTDADGAVIVGGVTIANVVPGGGDANAVKAVGFDLHFNGKPSLTEPAAASALTATIAAGSVSGTTKATATPAVGNHLGYRLTSEAVTANGRQYVDQYTAYTSAGNIPAESGQFLSVYEIDAYEHLVKFVCQELDSGDIAA